MSRILITGASGLLGLNFALRYTPNHEVIGVLNKHKLKTAPFTVIQTDLVDPNEARKIIHETKPDVIIHCAAMAILDECEKQPERANIINGELPGWLAAEARQNAIRFVHLSTDAVFDGVRGNYDEEDTPNPLSVYAKSKLAGEQAVETANPEAIIARVNFYGWSMSGTRSLSEWFYRNLAAGNKIKGFTDIYFCPLFVDDLADILLRMLHTGLKGIYHVVSPEALSKYDFGVRLAKNFSFDPDLIEPVSWKTGGLVAARSPNLTLQTNKLGRDLGILPPAQAQGIQKFTQQHLHGFSEQIKSLAE